MSAMKTLRSVVRTASQVSTRQTRFSPSIFSRSVPLGSGYFNHQKSNFSWFCNGEVEADPPADPPKLQIPPNPQNTVPWSFRTDLPPLHEFYDFALVVDLFNDLHTPKVTVTDADFAECNGTYRAVLNAHNDKCLYRNPKGAVIYFDNGAWKMNMNSGTDSFKYSQACTEDHPPSGFWIGTQGDSSQVEANCSSCPGWSILTDTSIESAKTRHATTFVILGNNKKGKTWIMSQLSRCDLPFDVQMHTPGICMKEFQLNGNPDLFRLIDSKGENTPLCEVSTESLKERTLEESFFREVTCEMADAFLYVVGDMGYDEQTTLNSLSEQLSSNKNTANQIIVVHNLKHVCTREGLLKRFQELKNIFCQQHFLHMQHGKLHFLQRGDSGDNMAAVHLVLGRSGSEADMFDGVSHNELVFDKIRSMMSHLPKKALALDKTFGDELAEVMTRKISRYYPSSKDVAVTHRKEDMKMSLEHSGCWKVLKTLDVSLGNFIKIDNSSDPPYTISEKDGVRIVRICAPGLALEKLEQNQEALKYDELEDGSVFVELDMEPLSPVYDGEIFQKPAAPTHNICKINAGKRTRSVEPDAGTPTANLKPGTQLQDGVLMLSWKLR